MKVQSSRLNQSKPQEGSASVAPTLKTKHPVFADLTQQEQGHISSLILYGRDFRAVQQLRNRHACFSIQNWLRDWFLKYTEWCDFFWKAYSRDTILPFSSNKYPHLDQSS
uniref:Uncharacterized protein n=1 Tax=Sphaerodactylus townsendi TaxID=933632 RepID=A0ACB8EDP6_9SAUR